MIATPMRISSFLSSFDDCRLQVAVLSRTLILYRISATGTSFSDHSRKMAA